MISIVRIRNIPNKSEFHKLLTVLKNKYGGRFAEFLIVDIGFNKFYYLYKCSGLYDIIKIMQTINDRFDSEYLTQYNVRLTDSIIDRNNGEEFILHITERSRTYIENVLRDINIDISEFGLMCCILTFNNVQDIFDDKCTEKFEVYYRDDGYYKIIKENINNSAKRGILWIIESIPKMLEEIEEKEINIKYLTEKGKEVDYRLRDRLIYKIEAADESISFIENSGIELPIKLSLEILAFKENFELRRSVLSSMRINR